MTTVSPSRTQSVRSFRPGCSVFFPTRVLEIFVARDAFELAIQVLYRRAHAPISDSRHVRPLYIVQTTSEISSGKCLVNRILMLFGECEGRVKVLNLGVACLDMSEVDCGALLANQLY